LFTLGTIEHGKPFFIGLKMSFDNIRAFKGVWFPAEIWLLKDLSLIEKGLLIEIGSLDSSEKHCFATNQYFSKFFQVSLATIKRSIQKLIKLGYIKSIGSDKKRALMSIYKSGVAQNEPDVAQNELGVAQNEPHNNISNNISNNKESKKESKLSLRDTKENYFYNEDQLIDKDRIPVKTIINLYQTLCPTLPKVLYMTEKRKRLLQNLVISLIPSLKGWETFFTLVSKNNFLLGNQPNQKWKANFDWLIIFNNAIKVIEEQYG